MSGFWKDAKDHFVHGTPPEQETHAQQVYDSISTLPMFVASILWFIGVFFQFDPALREMYGADGRLLGAITWMLFALDFVVRFVLDPDKRSFLRRDGFLLIALVFPPLRILLVISAVRRIARDRNSLAKMVGLYAVYFLLLVVLLGALFTLAFEVRAPDSTIDSYGDAVWWGFVTVTTVGYGDFTPVTVPGRMVGVTIMFAGAGAVGAVTAALASRFVSGQSRQDRSESSEDSGSTMVDVHPSPAITALVETESSTMSSLQQQVEALQQQIASIAQHLGVGADGTTAPSVTSSGATSDGDAHG